MAPKFRESEFIDFNSGLVKIAPLQMQFRIRMAGEAHMSDLIRLFQCRVEVWQLGVAAQVVNYIEHGTPPSVWAHAAYSVTAILIDYFETIGAILNEDNSSSISAATPAAQPVFSTNEAANFETCFYDVYPDFTTSTGAKIAPREFHERMRNGLFALGSTPRGLWMHNSRSVSLQDFDVIQKNPADASTLRYYINPHSMVRTLINHFPTVIARLNNPDTQYEPLRARLQMFLGDETSTSS